MVDSARQAAALAADTPEAVRSDLEALLADHGRGIYLRRQLAQAAEHGAALLAALGLPQLVDPDFVSLDPVAIGDALDLAIATLDALDAPDEDREPYLAGDYNGAVDPTGEGEPSENDEDDGTTEPSLGAPERHPYAWTMTDNFYRPAEGKRLMRYRRHESQVSWAQGRSGDVEDDINDQPQDEDELDDDGLSRGESDRADDEPPLGSPIGNGDQEHWSQGACHVDEPEEVNEDGDDSGNRPGPRLRPIGPSRPRGPVYDYTSDLRALRRQAEAIRRKVDQVAPPSRPNPDAVIPIGPGMVWWAGPAL